MVLTTWGVGSAIGIWVVETRDVAKYPTMYKTAPQSQQIGPQMLLVQRLKSPDLNSGMHG